MTLKIGDVEVGGGRGDGGGGGVVLPSLSSLATGSINSLKKIVNKTDVSVQLKKFDTRYNRIGYNIDNGQTARMVVNPIMVDNFASLFDCTTVGRSSD